MLRRAAYALLILAAATLSAFAQSPYPPGPPPPVPGLPDAPRQTTYTISGSTCACAVGFQLYGDSTDYSAWIEVWLNGVQVQYNDPVYGWALSSPAGALSIIPRPITDAVVTFNNAQTGAVVIVGARRPRRTTEYSENTGVPARALNQAYNDLYAIAREFWDKTNDLSGRGLFTQPGNHMSMLPLPSQCASSYLTFDSTGLIPLCLPLQTGSIAQLSVGQSNLLNGTNGCQLYDNNGVLGCQTFANALSVGTTAINNAAANGCALFNNNGILGCSTTSVLRTKLGAPTTFYVSTTGTDTTGCGTSLSPCHSRQYVINNLSANYDLGGQTATIQMAAGTYTDGVSWNGLLIGQNGAGGLIFTGDCSSAANTKNVLIQPTSVVNSYALAFGAAATLQCQKLDHSKILSVTAGADIVSIGQGAAITLGNSALYCPGGVCSNGYADLTFGCNVNPWNGVSAAFRVYVSIVNDLNIDQSSCLVTTLANTTSGSGVLTGVGTTAGLVQYMGIAGLNIPGDAFVQSFTSNTVTMGCLYTSPCQASASGTSITFQFAGGGQSFIDLGNGGQLYVNTNGDPSYSIFFNFLTYNYYYAGFFFVNDLSGANAGGITFPSWGLAHGGCVTVQGLSVFTSYLAGSPYIPCSAAQPIASTSITTTAGSSAATLASGTGFAVGDLISDVATPTATFTAGSSTISVSSATNIKVGMFVRGPGILDGARVTAVSGTTITLGGCGVGPRCVSGSPVYLSESSVTVYFKNGCLASGTKINSISGTSVSLLPPAAQSCTSVTIWATGLVFDNSIYQ